MDGCECMAKCTFFVDQMLELPGFADMLKNKYCRGNYDMCARHLVQETMGCGGVPRDLFPNQTDRAREMLAA